MGEQACLGGRGACRFGVRAGVGRLFQLLLFELDDLGVGPMTVTMLLVNTIASAERTVARRT